MVDIDNDQVTSPGVACALVSPDGEGEGDHNMPCIGPRVGIWPAIACGVLVLAAVGAGWSWTRWRRDPDLVARAAAAYAAGDWNLAADIARQRLKGTPQDHDAVRLLARALARLGRDTPANALFARLGAEALHAEDLFLLGLGLERAGRKADAARMWEKALGLQRDCAEVLDRLIILEMSRNRLTEASELALRLTRQPGWELRGELALGVLRSQLSDPAGAATVLERALGRPEAARLDRPALSRYRKLYARALLRTGRPAEARPLLRKVFDDSPDQETAWLSSRAALAEGSLVDAVAALGMAGSYRALHPLESEPSPFIGEARCASCHRSVFRSLQASRHSSTLLRGQPLAALPYPDQPIPDPDDPSVIHEFRRDGGQVRFQTTAGDRVLRAVVDYAFGSPDHYVSLVGRDDHGRSRILRLSRYSNRHDSGWVRTTGHTPQATEGSDLLGKSLDAADGLFKCLFCHSTNPRSVLDDAGPEASDRGIGCERCHGPGALHEKAVAAKFPDLAIVSPGSARAEGRVRICGECHSHHQELSLPRNDPYWIRFQGTTLTWSRCFTESEGALDCMTCHDPHHDTDRSEQKHTAICLSCHSPAGSVVRKPTAHTGEFRRSTCPVNPTQGCIGCHMPPFRSEPLHATFSDHYIRVHPRGESHSLK
jgi:tetratricopeptide (TPR) repeat protein